MEVSGPKFKCSLFCILVTKNISRFFFSSRASSIGDSLSPPFNFVSKVRPEWSAQTEPLNHGAPWEPPPKRQITSRTSHLHISFAGSIRVYNCPFVFPTLIFIFLLRKTKYIHLRNYFLYVNIVFVI